MSDDDDAIERRVAIDAFGHHFESLLPDLAEDLRTRERDGAVYCHFADRDGAGHPASR